MKKLFLSSILLILFSTSCHIESGQYETTSYSYRNLNSATAAEFYRQDPVYIIIYTAPPLARTEYIPAAPSTTVIWIPGCWNLNSSQYNWRNGYYTPRRVGWFWRVPRYMGGRYYHGKWIRGRAPRWHYSYRAKAGSYYRTPRYSRYTSRNRIRNNSRGYHHRRTSPKYRIPRTNRRHNYNQRKLPRGIQPPPIPKVTRSIRYRTPIYRRPSIKTRRRSIVTTRRPHVYRRPTPVRRPRVTYRRPTTTRRRPVYRSPNTTRRTPTRRPRYTRPTRRKSRPRRSAPRRSKPTRSRSRRRSRSI
jgi:hypothetical protein